MTQILLVVSVHEKERWGVRGSLFFFRLIPLFAHLFSESNSICKKYTLLLIVHNVSVICLTFINKCFLVKRLDLLLLPSLSIICHFIFQLYWTIKLYYSTLHLCTFLQVWRASKWDINIMRFVWKTGGMGTFPVHWENF